MRNNCLAIMDIVVTSSLDTPKLESIGVGIVGLFKFDETTPSIKYHPNGFQQCVFEKRQQL